MSSEQQSSGWHPDWEKNIYGKGYQFNRYPFESVVRFIMGNCASVADRSQIKILELGCGAGNNLWFAAREGFTVAGIEGSASAVEYARNRFAKEGLSGDLRVGDFASLPWDDESFDFVLDRGALTCVRRHVIESALSESQRVLKSGGRLQSIIYSSQHPDRQFGKDLGDNTYSDFTDGYFQSLGTAHFTDLEEINEIYGSRFTLNSVVHVLEEETLEPTKIFDAYWKIEATKHK